MSSLILPNALEHAQDAPKHRLDATVAHNATLPSVSALATLTLDSQAQSQATAFLHNLEQSAVDGALQPQPNLTAPTGLKSMSSCLHLKDSHTPATLVHPTLLDITACDGAQVTQLSQAAQFAHDSQTTQSSQEALFSQVSHNSQVIQTYQEALDSQNTEFIQHSQATHNSQVLTPVASLNLEPSNTDLKASSEQVALAEVAISQDKFAPAQEEVATQDNFTPTQDALCVASYDESTAQLTYPNSANLSAIAPQALPVTQNHLIQAPVRLHTAATLHLENNTTDKIAGADCALTEIEPALPQDLNKNKDYPEDNLHKIVDNFHEIVDSILEPVDSLHEIVDSLHEPVTNTKLASPVSQDNHALACMDMPQDAPSELAKTKLQPDSPALTLEDTELSTQATSPALTLIDTEPNTNQLEQTTFSYLEANLTPHVCIMPKTHHAELWQATVHESLTNEGQLLVSHAGPSFIAQYPSASPLPLPKALHKNTTTYSLPSNANLLPNAQLMPELDKANLDVSSHSLVPQPSISKDSDKTDFAQERSALEDLTQASCVQNYADINSANQVKLVADSLDQVDNDKARADKTNLPQAKREQEKREQAKPKQDSTKTDSTHKQASSTSVTTQGTAHNKRKHWWQHRTPEPSPLLGAHRHDLITQSLRQQVFYVSASLGGISCAFLATGALIYTLTQSHIVPYVVTVDSHGVVLNQGKADAKKHIPKAVITAQLCDFIRNVRMLSTDSKVQQQAILNAYAFVKPNTTSAEQLNEFYATHNPFKDNHKQQTTINIANVLETGSNTFQIDWVENTTGHEQKRMRALLSYSLQPIASTDAEALLRNPLGLYVDNFVLSQLFS